MTGTQLQLPMPQPRAPGLIRPAKLSNPAFIRAFWTRVNKWPGPQATSDCWLWTGCIGKGRGDGYGTLCCEGRVQRAHRVAWQIANGPIPAGMQVLHHCDTRNCVKPEHLFLGTNYDNVQDKVAKGRHPRGLQASLTSNPRRGEDHPKALLTEARVLEMRSLYTGGMRVKAIADRFGMRCHVANMVIHGRRWAHVPGAVAPNPHVARVHSKEIAQFTKEGLTLRQIGNRLGFSEAAICRVRMQYRLGGL